MIFYNNPIQKHQMSTMIWMVFVAVVNKIYDICRAVLWHCGSFYWGFYCICTLFYILLIAGCKQGYQVSEMIEIFVCFPIHIVRDMWGKGGAYLFIYCSYVCMFICLLNVFKHLDNLHDEKKTLKLIFKGIKNQKIFYWPHHHFSCEK